MAAAVLAASLFPAGCIGLLRSHDTTSDGLSRYDAELRRSLSSGEFDTVLARVAPERSDVGDELLRLQHEALVAHYAERHAQSNEALQRASALAEERFTKSISRMLLSAISNDRVLPYDPPSTERLLFHFYGALNYLRAGNPEGAAVEARRLSHLLSLGEEDARREAGSALHATLRYFAGAVFEATGERNDADVAYRLAERIRGARSYGGDLPGESGSSAEAGALADSSVREIPGSRAAAPGDSLGEVVVVVERGFVAHRVGRSTTLLLWPDELEALQMDAGAEDEEEGALEVALEIAGRELAGEGAPDSAVRPARSSSSGGSSGRGAAILRAHGPLDGNGRASLEESEPDAVEDEVEGEKPYLLRVAWSRYAEPEPAAGSVRVRSSAGHRSPLTWETNLSAAVVEESRSGETLTLAKAILRSAAKYGAVRLVEEVASSQDETLGEVAGILANVGTALLEQADTRSWHLLPAEIGIARLTLPAGARHLELEMPGPGADTGRLDLGEVDVRPGEVTVVSGRIWR